MSVNVSSICGIMITSRSERKELFGCDIFTISSPTVSVVKGRSGDRSSFSLPSARKRGIMRLDLSVEEMKMKVNIQVNTNNYNGKKVEIESGAIEKFTRDAFREDVCEASVEFKCLPAAIPPDFIQVMISEFEKGVYIVGDITAIVTVVKLVYVFLTKCTGYEKTIAFSDREELITVTDETTELELRGQIQAILLEQEEKTGKDISKILGE